MSQSKVVEITQPIIHPSQMKFGEYGEIVSHVSYTDLIGSIVLCSYAKDGINIVSLSKCKNWAYSKEEIEILDDNKGFLVRILPKGSKIEIIV